MNTDGKILKKINHKLNSVAQLKNHSLWLNGIYLGMQDQCNADKSISMIHDINRMKENNPKFTSIDEERALRKKLTSIHDENS